MVTGKGHPLLPRAELFATRPKAGKIQDAGGPLPGGLSGLGRCVWMSVDAVCRGEACLHRHKESTSSSASAASPLCGCFRAPVRAFTAVWWHSFDHRRQRHKYIPFGTLLPAPLIPKIPHFQTNYKLFLFVLLSISLPLPCLIFPPIAADIMSPLTLHLAACLLPLDGQHQVRGLAGLLAAPFSVSGIAPWARQEHSQDFTTPCEDPFTQHPSVEVSRCVWGPAGMGTSVKCNTLWKLGQMLCRVCFSSIDVLDRGAVGPVVGKTGCTV